MPSETPLILNTEENHEDGIIFHDENNDAQDEDIESEEDVAASPVKNTRKKNKKMGDKGELPDRKWRKKVVKTDIPDYVHPVGAIEDHFAGCETGTDVFMLILDSTLDNIVYQSNLYATQRGKTLNLKKDELLTFIGMNLLMGYHKLPSWRHYWSTSPDLGVPIVSNAMSRNRFDAILSNIHVNDNAQIPVNNTDKLYKIRPMIDTLNETFSRYYHGTREMSVDESMILFKGRSSLKQYNPLKPIKRGYKIWCLSDQKGFISKFDIYQGKNAEVEEEFKNFSLGERVVLFLTKQDWGKHKMIFFDNYFTSIPLLEKLKCENILACGTIRSNKKGLPKNLIADKDLQRGSYDYRCSSLGISVYKWKDNKVVYLASNFHGSEEVTVSRTQKDGQKIDVLAPSVVRDYNNFMGGVDHADRLRAVYGLDRRSKKWWQRIFWGLIDMAFVNSYVIFSDIREKIPLLEYRRGIALGLMAQQKCKTVKRRSQDVPHQPQCKKRRGVSYSVSADVRLGNRGAHWIKFTDRRGRCEVCSVNKVQSRPHSVCSLCNVFLCCNEKKNCFSIYHGVE